jgi:two-component system, cell cycle response regulator
MARIEQKESSGRTILLVDDQEDYRISAASLLKREGHAVLTAACGEEAVSLIRRRSFDLLLLDYYMPGGMTGEETVVEVRKFNPHIQVIIQTGYAGELPPSEMLSRLDIQGYYDKTEGPEKLLLWVDIGLKSASAVNLLNRGRRGLGFILDTTPELHKVQPIDDLLQDILAKTSAMLGLLNAFPSIIPDDRVLIREPYDPEGFLATIEESGDLLIRATTERFLRTSKSIESRAAGDEYSELKDLAEILEEKKVRISDRASIIPLAIGDQILGLIYLEQPVHSAADVEYLQIFANQAAVALQNARLYEMATIDPLTGAFVRRFFNQCLVRELRAAFRQRSALSFLMIDMDGLKRINDSAGHIAGDRALAACGKVLRQATRNTDFVGRYGGDEFAVLLPQTGREGAEVVCARILESLSDKEIRTASQALPIRLSIGAIDIGIQEEGGKEIPHRLPKDYFEDIARDLTKRADEKLYEAKREGGARACFDCTASWAYFE